MPDLTSLPTGIDKPQRIVFAGTPEFARIALEALLVAGFEVPLVLTQPDRPAGRGLKSQASPVKTWALQQGLSVLTPTHLRLDSQDPDQTQQVLELQWAMAQLDVQAMVVAAYGLLLPAWVLNAFKGPHRWGCFNIHASLLPRWRGAAPIVRAIEAGDTQTGVCIMQMEPGLDTGPVHWRVSCPIGPEQTAGELHDELAHLGAKAIVQVLQQPHAYAPQAQSSSGVCYAHKLNKTQAVLDWTRSAHDLACQIRAFAPQPGARLFYGKELIKVCRAHVAPLSPSMEQRKALPGEIIKIDEQGIHVQCGQGQSRSRSRSELSLVQLQRPGGKPLPAAVVARGLGMQVGYFLNEVSDKG
jgi:methionyl-tRNA formyltransferase